MAVQVSHLPSREIVASEQSCTDKYNSRADDQVTGVGEDCMAASWFHSLTTCSCR